MAANGKFSEIFFRLRELEQEVFQAIKDRLDTTIGGINNNTATTTKLIEEIQQRHTALEQRVTTTPTVTFSVCNCGQKLSQIEQMNKKHADKILLTESEIKEIKQQNNKLLLENTKLQDMLKDLKISVYQDKIDTRERIKNLSKEIEISYKFKSRDNKDQFKIESLEKQYQTLLEISNKNKLEISNFKQMTENNYKQIYITNSTYNKEQSAKLLEIDKQINQDQITQTELTSEIKLLQERLGLFEQNQHKKNIELCTNHTNILQQILLTSNDLTEKQDRKITELTSKTYRALDFLQHKIDKDISQNNDLITQNKLEQIKFNNDLIQINKNNLDKEQIMKNLELKLVVTLNKIDLNSRIIQNQQVVMNNFSTFSSNKLLKLEQSLQLFQINQNDKNLIFQRNNNDLLEQIKMASQNSLEDTEKKNIQLQNTIRKNQKLSLEMIEILESKCEIGKTLLNKIEHHLGKVNKSNEQKFLELQIQNKEFVTCLNDLKGRGIETSEKQEQIQMTMGELQNILSPFNLNNLIYSEIEGFVNQERRGKGQDILKHFYNLVTDKQKCKYVKHYKKKSVHNNNFLNIESCINALNFRNIIKDKQIKLKLRELNNQGKYRINLLQEAKFKLNKKQIKKHLISQNKAHCEIKPLIKRKNLQIKDEIKRRKKINMKSKLLTLLNIGKVPD